MVEGGKERKVINKYGNMVIRKPETGCRTDVLKGQN
jgi:hypothetical protein